MVKKFAQKKGHPGQAHAAVPRTRVAPRVGRAVAIHERVRPSAPSERLLDPGRDLRNTAAVIGAGESLEPAPPSGLGGPAVHGILALGLEKMVALGIALYLPRHLGLADYGRYVFLVSYLGFFQALPDAALEVVLVARLAWRSGSRRKARSAAI